MFALALAFGLSNAIGGRWKDIAGIGASSGRLMFRCILPAILCGFDAMENGVSPLHVFLAVLIGSAVWFPKGWSFTEITGVDDPAKYPSWVRKIGLWAYPEDISASTNRKRAIVMKGIRGMFDGVTFGLLAFINPMALVLWLGTGLMGVVYWASGRIVPQKYSVLLGEFAYGAYRGALIKLAFS